jgi:multidrug resistance efflux pump
MAAVASSSLPSATAADPWRALAAANRADELCQAWLVVLAASLTQARAGLLLLAQADGAYAPVAAVPPTRDLSYLSEIATDALRSREGVVRHDELGHARLAYPLQLAADKVAGAVVLDLGPVDAAALERALRLTHWGAGWLLDLLRQRESQAALAATAQGRFVLDTVLALQNERSEREAALQLVNRVARRLDARQVLLGVARDHGGQTLKVLAVSHSAVFDDRAGALNLATQAMHEAFDQRRRVDWPAPAGASPLAAGVAVAHQRYAAEAGAAAVTSAPLVGVDRVMGVLLVERDGPLSAAETELLDALVLALAPLLELQREAQQGALSRAWRTVKRGLGWLGSGSHPALKLGVAAAALVLLLLAVWPVPFRINSQAVVEGAVQRSVVAPFEGFLREAPGRAGDAVKAGQVLARLDDKDLKLEKVRWESELEVAQRKEREALAKGNRVELRLASAQANQARAQLDLVANKLERVEVSAPFDGLIVKGDLSQQLGSPLEQGKVLFELAPLDAWRVILKVDERDIGEVKEGAAGELVLSSLPGQAWRFVVRKVTPVSVAEEGRNYFRVEAELDDKAARLSPNMEGVAKVEAGRASPLWIWTRPLVHWLRISWWKWMP